jgi:cyclic beta-1,2-glucan synthetase
MISRKDRDLGILLSFHTDERDAITTSQRLRRNRIRRAVLVHRSADGTVRKDDVTPHYGALLGSACGLVLGIVVAYHILGLSELLTGVVGYVAFLLASVTGACGGWFAVYFLNPGVEAGLVEKYAQRLAGGETMLIVRGNSPTMRRALSLLRNAETRSSIFVFHPELALDDSSAPEEGEPLTIQQLAEHARHLTAGHRVGAYVSRGEPILRQLDQCERVIDEIRRDLAEAAHLEQRMTSSAEWLLDNVRMVFAQIEDVRLNLSRKFYHQLPVLVATGPHPGEPRIYRLAVELITHSDGHLDRHIIGDFLEAYQSVTPLRISELWALPLMLRIALIDRLRYLAEQLDRRMREREHAEFWADRLLTVARRDQNRLFSFLADLAQEQLEPSAHFAFQLTRQLYDEDTALVPVRSWLERKLGTTLGEVVLGEQAAQAAANASIGNVVTSLRQLGLMDWRDIFQEQSLVDRTLCEEPEGIYHHMDFETRDRYRKAVEELARASGAEESSVAREAVDLVIAGIEDTLGDEQRRHVGYYLIGTGRPELVERLRCSEIFQRRLLNWVYARHTCLYLSAVGILTAGTVLFLMLLGEWKGHMAAILLPYAILGLLPVTQIAVLVVNYMTTRCLPPRLLPKMSFVKDGIPDEYRTLVVVPMMLVSEQNVRDEIEKLEIRYLANPDANLLFSLFSDFVDAPEVRGEGDEEFLQTVVTGIEELNNRYGAGRFYLFHRKRVWTDSEGCYIGWERKRGKLETLNRLLNGDTEPGGENIVYVGDRDRLADVRFVITLDSDTHMPRDSARRLIETISHPLNLRNGELTDGAYNIIQPRVTTDLPSATATLFSRLFTDPVGIDPYTKAVSDVYQDLSGEGSYIGKGIYDPRAFHRVLTGRFPEQRLLSHDLIEGAHLRVAFASDIELYDEFPPDYPTYAHRQHRWIRGDWQIADWCLPRVPGPNRQHVRNPLSLLNRWKIFDNLRRSLVPASLVSFLVFAWLCSPFLGMTASVIAGLLLLFPPSAQLVTLATKRPGKETSSWRERWHSFRRSLVETAFLIHQAGSALDAICRVWFRRWVSGKHMLQWTTAQAAPDLMQAQGRGFFLQMLSISALSLCLTSVLWFVRPESLPAAAPFLILWVFSPMISVLLKARAVTVSPKSVVSAAHEERLRQTARQTWRYFADFVGPDTSWLPPDNFQASHGRVLAMRTSPTNIGLWLLSALGAHDFGYLTVDEMIGCMLQSFRTVKGLERYNGHLLNWYDIRTLKPLEPRYVSTVDSGNLLGCLWTLDEGMREVVDKPLLGPQVLRGIRDTFRVLHTALQKADLLREHHHVLSILQKHLTDPPEDLAEMILCIRRAVAPTSLLANALREGKSDTEKVLYWAEQLELEVAGWVTLIDRYLSWVDLLADGADGLLAELGPEAAKARDRALAQVPSLRALATGEVPALRDLSLAIEKAGELPDMLREVARVLVETTEKAQWFAGEMIERQEEVLGECRALAEGMSMQFLYNADRRLFAVGYNVSNQRMDGSYYDLFASEARLASYLAIAKGDVPAKHWLAMSRPYGSMRRRRVLLSWSGSMFEYFMPLIFQRSFANSLLDNACREAVRAQQEYGRRLGVPWGISESAYSDLDANKTYQYQAFGVPGLGLKRGLEDELVVAPYATLLALSMDPDGAVANLEALERLGLYGEYGFFEAVDFSRQRQREGERGVIVHAYMVHHQAMGFLALDNFLNGGAIKRRFHADARVRATEPLLYERIPVSPPVYHAPLTERSPSRLIHDEIAPSTSTFDTPHTPNPWAQLLSNGRYSLMVTGAGGGYSRWEGFELTRWRADSTVDAWGTFCYLRDRDTDHAWSNTYQPVRGSIENYSVSFAADRTDIRRSDDGVETETAIVVAPEDDVEIRHISLINRSDRVRNLEITSYVELALARHTADRQHPAFNKLFIKTEALREHGALVASRRLREPEEPPVWVCHLLTEPTSTGEEVQFELDRRRFLGRGRTTENPAALHGDLSNSTGHVLDPIFSLRRYLTLEPGQRVEFSLILGAARTRDEVLALVEKYADAHAVERQIDLAWSHAQLELRYLRVQADEVRRFRQLVDLLIYPSRQLRPFSEQLKRNRLGQSRLWPYGISGDNPICVVTIGESRDISLIRQLLQAHTYWHLHGLKVDLVIFNEESGSYDQPLNEQLKHLIKGHSVHTGVDISGGVYLLTMDQIPEEDVTLILTAAHVALVAARGTLAQQLAIKTDEINLPALLETQYMEEEPSAPIPFMELSYFNGLGGFTPDGKEYVIYLGPDTWCPAPWVNVIANATFGTLVSESGSGFTWYGNSQQNRITGWSNDPVSDTPSEAVYIRDEESGIFWSPTPLPIREADAYRARHGAGYTVFEHNSHAVEQELTVFVPTDETGGDAVCLKRLRLRNDGHRLKRLSVTFYAEWTLGDHRENTRLHFVTEYDNQSRTVLAYNRYHPAYSDHVAFATLTPAPHTGTTDRTEFLGRNGSMADPSAMKRVWLSGRTGAGLDACAALQIKVDLAPGQETEVTFLLGEAASLEAARAMIAKYRRFGAVEEAMNRTQAWWDRLLGTVQVETPELSVNLLLNRWLLYQSLSCRIWGRSGFYQSGGAYGFRDQLQDMLALLHADPRLAREHIIRAAGRQFREGDVQHWWHPPTGIGIRSRCSDDLLWLPFAVEHYVNFTGDMELLNEQIPFLDARPLEADEHEVFLSPTQTIERHSLYEHCRRALERGFTRGPHGLPLIGGGDWNDGMNRVGVEGLGESVWLAWFLVTVLTSFGNLAERYGKSKDAEIYRVRASEFAAAVEKHAWDGSWYRRAYFDDQTPLGSATCEEARIDSLPQSWAVISGAADPARSKQAIASAWEHLVREDERLILLFTPPFDKAPVYPGYIKGYPPGVRENGGQYTHGALWLALAIARQGDGDRASKLLRFLNPIEQSREPEDVARYVVEPYVLAADVYRLDGHIGRGGWTWYTGSASWMYRVWIEEIFGLKVRSERLTVDPVLPSSWERISVTYRREKAVYEITIENPEGVGKGVAWVELDGRRLEDRVIPIEERLIKHRVRVRLGTGEDPAS